MPSPFTFDNTAALGFALQVAVRVSFVFIAAALISIWLRRGSAAVRHRVWGLAFCGAVVIPILWTTIPVQGVPLLPADAAPLNAELESESPVPADVPDTLIESANHVRPSMSQHRLREPLLPAETANQGAPAATVTATASHTASENDAPTDPARPTALSRIPWGVVVWSIGCLFAVFPLAAGVLRSRRLLTGARRVADDPLLAELSQQLGIRRTVRLYESDRDVVPMTWGIARPLILLPTGHKQWNVQRRRIVLLHELAHIRRFDLPLQIVARIACALYWFNPLTWWGLSRLRLECERACDDLVLHGGEQAFNYASQLVDIADSYRAPQMLEVVAMARSSELEVRVRSLLDSARSHRPLSALCSFASIAAAIPLLLAVTALHPVPRAAIAYEGEQSATGESKPEQTLRAKRPTVDALGDPLPKGALMRMGTQRFEYPSNVLELALSPDEQTVVATGQGSLLIAWDAKTGKERWRANTRELGLDPPAASYGWRAIAFAPDSRNFYTPARNNRFLVWDTLAGTHETIAIQPSFPQLFGRIGSSGSVDVAPDGDSLAVGNSKGLAVCDQSGAVKFRIANVPKQEVRAADMNRDRLWFGGDFSYARYAPDGQAIAVVLSQSPKEIRLCSVTDGSDIRRIPLTHNLVRMEFTPDGGRIVVTERDSAIRMYSVSTGERLWEHAIELKNKAESYMCGVACSPDGKTIAACAPIGSDYWIYLLQTDTGDVQGILKGHQWKPWAVAFTADSKTLYSSGWDGTIRRWDVASQKQLPPPSGVRATAVVAASPDSKNLAYQDDQGTIRLVDAQHGNELDTLSLRGTRFSQLKFSPNSNLLAAAGTSGENINVTIFDLSDGKVAERWKWAKGRDPHSHVNEVCFTPDGHYLAAAVFRQSKAYVWDLSAGEQVAELEHREVDGLSFSPDGKTLCTAGWDKKLRFWEAGTGVLQREFEVKPEADPDKRLGLLGHDTRMYTVRYAPQGGLIATAHLGGFVSIWDADSMRLLNGFSVQELFRYGTIDFSPDGLWLATGSDHREGQFVRLWDPLTGSIVWDAGRQEGNIYAVEFGKNNATLVSGAEDGTCYLWDLRPQEKLPAKSLPALWNDLGSDDSKTAYDVIWTFAETPQQSVDFLGQRLQAIKDVVDLQHVDPELDVDESQRRKRLRKVLVDKDATKERLLTVRRALSALVQIESPAAKLLLEKLAESHDHNDVRKFGRAALEQY